MKAAELKSDKLVTDLKRVVHDSEALLQSTAGALGDKSRELRERLTEAVEKTKQACQRLEEKAVEGARAADKAIHENPYPSIGVAFGIGLLIGVLVTRK